MSALLTLGFAWIAASTCSSNVGMGAKGQPPPLFDDDEEDEDEEDKDDAKGDAEAADKDVGPFADEEWYRICEPEVEV